MKESGRKRYSKDFKFRVALEAIRAEKTLAELASENNVPANLLSTWKKQLLERGPQVFDPGRSAGGRDRKEDPERLVKTIGEQQIQINSLRERARNLGYAERRSMISKNKELSIADQCKLLDVSRSGYYYKPRPETPYNETLMRRIDELHRAEPTWGSRMLCERLRTEGHQVNRKRIRRLMALMGIQTIYPGRNQSK